METELIENIEYKKEIILSERVDIETGIRIYLYRLSENLYFSITERTYLELKGKIENINKEL